MYMAYAVDEKKLGNTCICGQTCILAFMKKLCKIKLQQDVVVVVFGIQLVTPQPGTIVCKLRQTRYVQMYLVGILGLHVDCQQHVLVNHIKI